MPSDTVPGPLVELVGMASAVAGATQAAFGGLVSGFDAATVPRVLATLALPPALPLLVVALGLSLLGRMPRLGRSLAWAGVLTGVLVSSSLGAGLLAHWAEGDIRAPTADELRRAVAARDAPQAVVIIGGGARSAVRERPDAEFVKSNTLERLVHGAWVARVTGLPVLVSGGVSSAAAVSEASLMKRTLESALATPVRWVEDESRNTAANARLSAAILHAAGIRRVILVTHAYHMPRARASFERAGLAVLAAPHGFSASPLEAEARSLIPNGDAALTAYRASHELVGRLWYGLRDQ
jgi:uncharacterized SAM-binding protein YcdF (DUF218 family)